MKIILLKEVKGLGIAGEVKNVSNGYAQNFLFPKSLALVATEENVGLVSRCVNKKKTEKKAKRKNKKK